MHIDRFWRKVARQKIDRRVRLRKETAAAAVGARQALLKACCYYREGHSDSCTDDSDSKLLMLLKVLQICRKTGLYKQRKCNMWILLDYQTPIFMLLKLLEQHLVS